MSGPEFNPRDEEPISQAEWEKAMAEKAPGLLLTLEDIRIALDYASEGRNWRGVKPDLLGNQLNRALMHSTRRLFCNECGRSVSTPVPKDTIVRAWVECPECIEKHGEVGKHAAAQRAERKEPTAK